MCFSRHVIIHQICQVKITSYCVFHPLISTLGKLSQKIFVKVNKTLLLFKIWLVNWQLQLCKRLKYILMIKCSSFLKTGIIILFINYKVLWWNVVKCIRSLKISTTMLWWCIIIVVVYNESNFGFNVLLLPFFCGTTYFHKNNMNAHIQF